MFEEFPKIPRLNRNIYITEKIDGTNAQIEITDDGEFLVGSRSRYITPENDKHGFARWAHANKEELLKLGPGKHFGEWWGSGIRRGYGLKNGDKRFSLFNVGRWGVDGVPSVGMEKPPVCCSIVPVLYKGPFSEQAIKEVIQCLRTGGSCAVPGFMKPEGVIVYHEAARHCFKVTLEKDEEPKGRVAA